MHLDAGARGRLILFGAEAAAEAVVAGRVDAARDRVAHRGADAGSGGECHAEFGPTRPARRRDGHRGRRDDWERPGDGAAAAIDEADLTPVEGEAGERPLAPRDHEVLLVAAADRFDEVDRAAANPPAGQPGDQPALVHGQRRDRVRFDDVLPEETPGPEVHDREAAQRAVVVVGEILVVEGRDVRAVEHHRATGAEKDAPAPPERTAEDLAALPVNPRHIARSDGRRRRRPAHRRGGGSDQKGEPEHQRTRSLNVPSGSVPPQGIGVASQRLTSRAP